MNESPERHSRKEQFSGISLDDFTERIDDNNGRALLLAELSSIANDLTRNGLTPERLGDQVTAEQKELLENIRAAAAELRDRITSYAAGNTDLDLNDLNKEYEGIHYMREHAFDELSEHISRQDESEADISPDFESITAALKDPDATISNETVGRWVTNLRRRRSALKKAYARLQSDQKEHVQDDMDTITSADLSGDATNVQSYEWRYGFQSKMSELEKRIKALLRDKKVSTKKVEQVNEEPESDKPQQTPEAETAEPEQIQDVSEDDAKVELSEEVRAENIEERKLPENEHELIHEGWARWDEETPTRSTKETEENLESEESKGGVTGEYDPNFEINKQISAIRAEISELEASAWPPEEKILALEDELRDLEKQRIVVIDEAEADFSNVRPLEDTDLVEGEELTPDELNKIAERLGHGRPFLGGGPEEQLSEELGQPFTQEQINKLIAEGWDGKASPVSGVLPDTVPQENLPVPNYTESEEMKTEGDSASESPETDVSPADRDEEEEPDFETRHIDELKAKSENAWDAYHDALRKHLNERNVGKDIAESFGFRTKLPQDVQELKDAYETSRTDYTTASYGRAMRRIATEGKFDFGAARERRTKLERRYMARLVLSHVVRDAERIAQVKQEVLSEKKMGVGATLLSKWQQMPKWKRYGITAAGGTGFALSTGVVSGAAAAGVSLARLTLGSATVGAISPAVAKGFRSLHERLFTRRKREQDAALKKSATQKNYRRGGLREQLSDLSESHARVDRSEKRQRLTSTVGTVAVAGALGSQVSALGAVNEVPDASGVKATETTSASGPDGADAVGQSSGEISTNESDAIVELAAGAPSQGEEVTAYTLSGEGSDVWDVTEDFLEKKYPELDDTTRRIIADEFIHTVPKEMWERMGAPHDLMQIEPGTPLNYTQEAQEFIDNIVKDIEASRGGVGVSPTPEDQAMSASESVTESESAPERVVITPPAEGSEETVPTFVPPGTPPTFEPFAHEIVEGGTTWDSTEAYLEERHPYLSFDDRQEITKYFLENYLPNNPEVRGAMGLPENISQIQPGIAIDYPHEAQLWLYEAAARVESGNGVIEVNPDGTFR